MRFIVSRVDLKVTKAIAKPAKIRSANALVQARINKEVKVNAAHVLSSVGLSVSDAIRLLLTKIVNEEAVPFELITPNKQTMAAINELESGKGKKFNSIEELMADLQCE